MQGSWLRIVLRTAYDVSLFLSTHAIGSYTTYYKYTQRQSSVPCTQQLYIHFALSLRSSRRAASLRQITCMYLPVGTMYYIRYHYVFTLGYTLFV